MWNWYYMAILGGHLAMYLVAAVGELLLTRTLSDITVDKLGPILVELGKLAKIKEFTQGNVDWFIDKFKLGLPLILAIFRGDPQAVRLMRSMAARKITPAFIAQDPLLLNERFSQQVPAKSKKKRK